jgi:hypothetical protein
MYTRILIYFLLSFHCICHFATKWVKKVSHFVLYHLSGLASLSIDAYMSKQTKYAAAVQIRRNMACINTQNVSIACLGPW